MAKSNMRAVRMRRVNRQLHIQDQLRQKTEREVHTQRAERISQTASRRFSVVTHIRRIIGRIRDFFAPTSMVHLDMRRTSDLKRSAGANQLREWFPNLGKLVSTRDGRVV